MRTVSLYTIDMIDEYLCCSLNLPFIPTLSFLSSFLSIGLLIHQWILKTAPVLRICCLELMNGKSSRANSKIASIRPSLSICVECLLDLNSDYDQRDFALDLLTKEPSWNI